MKTNYRGFGAIEVAILLAVVGLLGFGGWYVWQSKDKYNSQQATNAQASTKQNTKENIVDILATYTNSKYDISLKYPKGWSESSTDGTSPVLQASFSSPDFNLATLDNGYRIDAGGAFYVWVNPLDTSNIDPAYKQSAEKNLGKSTIDDTADFIKLVQSEGGVEYVTYTSSETIDGIAAGRGRCGHYTHGPCVFWVKNSRLYQVVYDGPSDGFAVKPDPKEIGKYSQEFEAMLKSIKLE
jgi:hypothetical protein